MRILTASSLGICFGVRDALETARHADRPTQITVHGELVHNPLVTSELRDLGFTVPEGTPPSPTTPRVLITAHGISDRSRRALIEAGHELIDTTCPLVRRAHEAALELDRQGRHVLVAGRRGHVE